MNDELLENLYIINKKAKYYSEKSSEKYNDNEHLGSKIFSLRKNALYSMKSEILDNIKDESNKIQIHNINKKKYYCFFINGFSFHSPYEKHYINKENIDEEIKIENFDNNYYVKNINKSLKSSLKYFNKNYNMNANDYIETKYLENGRFTGWLFLY